VPEDARAETQKTVLVVESERSVWEALRDPLVRAGYRVLLAESALQAFEQLRTNPVDAVISSFELAGPGGREFLVRLTRERPSVAPILATHGGFAGNPYEAVTAGVYGRLLLPTEASDVLRTVHLALEKKRLEDENRQLRERLAQYDPLDSIQRTLSSCQALKLTLDTTFNLLKPEVAVLFLRDPVSGRYEIRDFCSRNPGKLAEAIGSPDLSALEKAIRHRPYILATGDRVDLFFRQKPSFGPLHTFFSVPVKNNGYLLGFINVCQFEASRYISVDQADLLAALAARVASAIHDADLFENLPVTFRRTIESFAQALERKDSYTAGHSDRTRILSSILLDGLSLPEPERRLILDAAQMHDIGKINIDLSALNQPGVLTPEQAAEFRLHPTFGREILEPIFFLSDLVPLVEHHHENFDGSGYPSGLTADVIPLGARVISIADSYDAMTSHRAYRRALSHEKAVAELKRTAGAQFDPRLVEIFVEQVRRQLTDGAITKFLKKPPD
jgi:response regulator RpfG family c-di-GMP phosphodiesterase